MASAVSSQVIVHFFDDEESKSKLQDIVRLVGPFLNIRGVVKSPYTKFLSFLQMATKSEASNSPPLTSAETPKQPEEIPPKKG